MSPLEPKLWAPPGRDCPLCPRLVAFRAGNRVANPDWHNAPVPSFGPLDASLLIVGLAPGLRGANRTGRPFTGDYAGELLYGSLCRFDLAEGGYGADPSDNLILKNCRITNAVRCVPPANLPKPNEIRACNHFLAGEIDAMPALRAILALGAVAHAAILRARRVRFKMFPFQHGAIYELPDGLVVGDSYHVSRQNTNTGRLNEAMFHSVLAQLRRRIVPDLTR